MTPTRRHPADRDRAVARLRSMTLGTAAGGLLGAIFFGAVAAASYDGTTSAVTTATTDQTTAAAATTDSSTTTDDTGSLQATPAPTTATGSAHASTGGS